MLARKSGRHMTTQACPGVVRVARLQGGRNVPGALEVLRDTFVKMGFVIQIIRLVASCAMCIIIDVLSRKTL